MHDRLIISWTKTVAANWCNRGARDWTTIQNFPTYQTKKKKKNNFLTDSTRFLSAFFSYQVADNLPHLCIFPILQYQTTNITFLHLHLHLQMSFSTFPRHATTLASLRTRKKRYINSYIIFFHLILREAKHRMIVTYSNLCKLFPIYR